MYKKSVCLLLVLVCLSLVTACGKKDDEVKAFVSDMNSFTDELVKKVESAPNPSQGVDDAQKYLDSRKSEIQNKFSSLKKIGDNQVSDETKKKMTDDMYQNGVKLGQLIAKYGSDQEVLTKLKKLTQDYQDLFKM